MSLKRIIGGVIVGLVFSTIFVSGAVDVGIKAAALIFIGAAAISALLYLGVWLMNE